MKKGIVAFGTSLSLVLLACPVVNAADTGQWIVEGGVSHKSINWEFTNTGNQFKGSYESLDLGLAYQFGSFSIAANIEAPLNKAEDDTETDSAFSSEPVRFSGELERNEQRITFSYSLWRQLAVFLGYKNGKSDREDKLRQDSALPIDYSGTFVGKDKGPFLGASYSWPLGASGYLGMSLAVAELDLTYAIDTELNNNVEPLLRESSTTGAYTANVKYLHALNENLNLYAGINWQSYDSSYLDLKQEIMGLSVGVNKVF